MKKGCSNYKSKLLSFFQTISNINEKYNEGLTDIVDDEISKELQIDDKQVLIDDILQIIPLIQELQAHNQSNLYDDVIDVILKEYKKNPTSLTICSLNNYLNTLYSIYYQLLSAEEQDDIDALIDNEDTDVNSDVDSNINNIQEAKSHQTSGQRQQTAIRRKADHAFKRKIALRLKRNKNLCSKAGPFSSWSNKLKKCVYKSPIKSAGLKIQARTRRKNM